MSEEDELIRLRRKINAIDDDIIAKLDERAAVAKDIGTLKQQMGLPIHDFSREREVINRLTSEDFQVVLPADIEKIYKEIMGACRHAEDLEEKVGFLGPEGSFAQIAAKDFFSEAGTVFMPFENSAQIFRALDAGSIEYGIVPIENSTQGTVPETLDLLLDSPSIKIIGEIEVKVHQALIVHPGVEDTSGIEVICSHPQGIAQTRKFVQERLPGVQVKEMYSTS